MDSFISKVLRATISLCNPRCYLHAFRIIHYYGYSHVNERRLMKVGTGTGIAPNVSLRNGALISIGQNCHVGERCYLWAGEKTGKIIVGNFVSFAPEVFITASDYQFAMGRPFRDQPRRERDVIIGNDVWLGARVIVTAGVTIGDGCIVGAGAVVTRDLPPNSICVGVPARRIAERTQSEVAA